MSQGLREMLANRRFAIPLIVLLAFCFVGLILVGVVLILKPGAPNGDGDVAQATNTPELESTVQATSTQVPTDAPTPQTDADLGAPGYASRLGIRRYARVLSGWGCDADNGCHGRTNGHCRSKRRGDRPSPSRMKNLPTRASAGDWCCLRASAWQCWQSRHAGSEWLDSRTVQARPPFYHTERRLCYLEPFAARMESISCSGSLTATAVL